MPTKVTYVFDIAQQSVACPGIIAWACGANIGSAYGLLVNNS